MKAQFTRWSLLLSLAAMGLGSTDSSVRVIEATKDADVTAVRALIARDRASVKATEPDGTTALHYAVHVDNLVLVNTLLQAGADAKATNRYGVTPLALAAENGNAAIIERLLKAGADPNTTQPGGETALMTAARTGKVDAIKMLLSHGADVNAKESTRNQTALMWAAVAGNGAAITALVEAGADINAHSTTPKKPTRRGGMMATNTMKPPPKGDKTPVDVYGSMTAITFAVRRGQMDAVKALVDKGANVNDTAVVHAGEPPTPIITLAIANAHYELAAYLLDRGADPNLADNGWTPLHQLARSRSEPGKVRTNEGWTPGPTMTGKMSGLELANKLIAKGAKVDARATREFEDGYRIAPYVSRIDATPLLMAARVCDVPMMKLLIEHGADVNAKSADGISVFMSAAGNGIRSPNEDGIDVDAPDAVKLLLSTKKVDVNDVDNRGWAPLHGAALRGSIPVIQLLSDAGAKLDAKTFDVGREGTDLGLAKRGWTPADVADGIVQGGIYFRSAPAAAHLRKLMAAQGLPIPPDDGLIRATYMDGEATEKRVKGTITSDGQVEAAKGAKPAKKQAVD